MLEAFASGEDAHYKTASLITGKPVSEVTKEERQRAKALNFGLAYGMGAAKFQAYARGYGVVLSLDEAAALRTSWFKALPRVKNWQKLVGLESEGSMSSTTLGGRVRRFIKDDRIFDMTKMRKVSREVNVRSSYIEDYYSYTEALNTVVQGTGADIMLEALKDLPPYLSRINGKLIASAHDELVLDVPKEYALDAVKELEKIMIDAAVRIVPEIPLKNLVEAKLADNWSK